MKKSIIIHAIILIIILIIIFWIYTGVWTKKANENSKNEFIEEGCEDEEGAENITICYTMLGIYNRNFEPCENLDEESDIDFCYINIIQETKMDLSECEDFKCNGYFALTMLANECDNQEREASRELCYKLAAKSIKRVGFCDKVDELHSNLCNDY
ncbi:hypothetical protein GOV12_00025 [Candidatus Pacearchaeota archaeon]|nr:hypothetical protein [Candidatus Pacearchaeota archaeon]